MRPARIIRSIKKIHEASRGFKYGHWRDALTEVFYYRLDNGTCKPPYRKFLGSLFIQHHYDIVECNDYYTRCVDDYSYCQMQIVISGMQFLADDFPKELSWMREDGNFFLCQRRNEDVG